MATDTTDSESKESSFFSAKWFPTTISILALAIAIGGHGFTAVNSQGLAGVKNSVDDLLVFRASTNDVDGLQDRQIQAMRNELVKQRRMIQELKAELESEESKQTTASSSSTSGTVRAVTPEREAQLFEQHRQAELKHQNDARDSPAIGAFSNALRAALKTRYTPPAWGQGVKIDEDDVVVLQITFARNGYIQDARIGISSGMEDFDNAALKAALLLNQFPAVARLDQKDYLRVARFQIGISPAQMK